jgi:hypothetical protein
MHTTALTCVVEVCGQLLLQAHNCLVVVVHLVGVQAKHAVALVALVGVWDEAADIVGVPVKDKKQR